MQKIIILIAIGLTSLIIMACGLGGFAQQQSETQPTITEKTNESSTQMEESQPFVESQPVTEIETQKVIENTPVPTRDPLDAAKSCLAKTWQISGLSDYVIAAVPPELAAEYSLEYIDTSGSANLTLSPDGFVLLEADQLEFQFNARLNIFEVPVTVRINGTAVGTYTVDSTNLTVNNMETSGLTASAQALNQDLMESDQIINSIPFIRPPFNTAKYNCQGDTLELNLSGYPGNLPPLVFQAAK